jgi:hypothetical protein
MKAQTATEYLIILAIVIIIVLIVVGVMGGIPGLNSNGVGVQQNRTQEDLCTITNGSVVMQACCKTIISFPNTCLVGACGCSLANSHDVDTCVCPDSQCYNPEVGCI